MKKDPRTLPRKIWKYDGKSNYQHFFSSRWSNAQFFCFIIEIWTFSFQNCFQNQFLTSGSGQTENVRIWYVNQMRIFSVLPLPGVQNWLWKQFWNEKVHISIQKKNQSVLTNGFPIVFSNLARKGSGFFFMLER